MLAGSSTAATTRVVDHVRGIGPNGPPKKEARAGAGTASAAARAAQCTIVAKRRIRNMGTFGALATVAQPDFVMRQSS
jgi:hypothetical protein